MAEIIITGVKELEAKCGRMRTITVLTMPMVRSLAKLNKTASTYPNRMARRASIAGMSTGAYRKYYTSSYIRTGHFGRAWEMRVENDGNTLEGQLNNPTPYGPYVMGPGPDRPMQAWMHVGIWRTTDDVVEKHESSIVADFQKAINAELAK